MSDKFKDRTILFTGGTGSFGNKIIRSMIENNLDYKEIRVFSRDELKQDIMRREINNSKVKFYIGDVRDRASVDNAMNGVDFVFHAAALKQVPSCEFFPSQAVLTNVIGSNNVIESAVQYKVKKVICLSTDKAVYPINAMGMTKALMEKIAQAKAMTLPNNDTIIGCIRYGNVMYSRGSVIPLFINQIKSNQPITITDASMTRFMLSLQDAIELVLFAFLHSRQGDLFIKKSPACTIGALAIALKRLFKSNVAVNKIGIRHGEKVFETLATVEELQRAEDMGDYFRIMKNDKDLNYQQYFEEGAKDNNMVSDYTSQNTKQLSLSEIESLLVSMPEIKHELESV